MKALLWQGHRVDTLDDLADAALELARLLVAFGRTERLDLPAEVDGRTGILSLLVGPGMGLGMLAAPGMPDRPLAGAADALAELRARIARLADAPGARGFRLPEDFTVLDHDITS